MTTKQTLILTLSLSVCGSALWGNAADTRNWAISPYIDLRAVYDDNIERTDQDEEDDIFLDATAGLRLGYTGHHINLLLGGFVSQRAYNDATDKDFTALGQTLRLQTGARDTIAVTIDQSLRRVEDTDLEQIELAPGEAIDVATRSQRTILQAGIRLGRDLTDKTGLDGGYRFGSVDYKEDALQTQRSHTANIESSYNLSDKSDALFGLQGTIQEGRDGASDTDSYAATLGLRTQSTEKLHLRATAGFQQYNRAAGGTEDSLIYGLQAALHATDKLTLQAAARNGTQRSSVVDGNDIEFMLFSLGARLQAMQTVSVLARISYREDDYLDPVLQQDTLIERTDKATTAALRVNYQTPSDILQLYAEAAFETVDSNVSEYDQTRLALGLQLQF